MTNYELRIGVSGPQSFGGDSGMYNDLREFRCLGSRGGIN